MNKIIKILISFVIVLSACDRHGDDDYQGFIDKIIEYQNGIELEFTEDNYQIDTTTFNINTYFNLFDKLKLESDFRLEYYYFYFGDGGRPLIFAVDSKISLNSVLLPFRTNQPPLITIGDTIIYDSVYLDNDFIDYSDTVLTPFNHIIMEDTPDGAFQLLTFYLLGDRFGLFSHSNYGGFNMICSNKKLNEIRNLKSDFTGFTREQKQQIKKIQPKPTVKTTQDTYEIEILGFNPWEGFSRIKYAIDKRFPHEIKYLNSEIIVKHDCGIMF
jgi:hypothetical protein